MKLIRIPTFADVHVHFRDPGATHKEDFESGTKAAIAGGYTQVLDMPNNDPPTVNESALRDKIKRAEGNIWCDMGFNFGATRESCKYFGKVRNNVFGLKVYMSETTGPLLVTEDEEREVIFQNWKSKMPIMIHAQDEIVENALRLAKKYKRKIHICHITANQLQPFLKARKDGIEISAEVTPHHLFLTTQDLKELGPFGLMKPPLLSKSDSNKLWDNLDKIDMISTDHAPHTIDEKQDKASPKFGVPGLETTMPLLLWAVKNKLVSQERVLKMLSENPRKIFSLPIQEDTYTEVDVSKEYKIGKRHFYTKCGWSPFKNHAGVGEIRKVVLRGKTIYENGIFVGEPLGKVMKSYEEQ